MIERSAEPERVSVSVAELFPGVGSVTPPGTLTVAVFDNEPVALDEMLAVRVYVAVPPTGRFTVSLILPVPEAAHDAPLDATHDQVAPLSALGNVSDTVAPVTADGPAFEATIVYVTEVPATSVNEPSVFVIDKSAEPERVSVSVAELFAGVGSVTPPGTLTVAVFDTEPVALDEMLAVRV